jgi:hypothetical protein
MPVDARIRQIRTAVDEILPMITTSTEDTETGRHPDDPAEVRCT